MDMQYLTRPEHLAWIPSDRIIVDFHAVLWTKNKHGMWIDGTGRERGNPHMVSMRGPVYLLPEGFTGQLTLDDLSDAEPGDYLLDKFGDHWGKTTAGRWLLSAEGDPRGIVKSSADLLDIYSPLLPAPRPGEAYAPPVPAMEAAAREEEARPVGFWRRLWNGLVWG